MGITRHALPNGAHADLRDHADVSERLRRPVRAIQMKLAKDPAFSGVVDAAKKGGADSVKDIDEDSAASMVSAMGDDAAALLDDLNDKVVLTRVVGWSFDLPVSADSLLDLPGPVYDRLRELCAEGALESTPDFSPSTDTASPTEPSTVSA